MARAQLASLGAGVAQRSTGAVAAYRPGTIYLHGTIDPVPVYPTEVGGIADESGEFMTDGLGKIPGWVEVGTVMDITVSPSTTVTAFASGPGEITALELGDRITWGGLIELWGDVTAAGYQVLHEDTFNTDTHADWGADAVWDVTDQRLEYTSVTDVGSRDDWGPHDDTARFAVEAVFTAGVSGNAGAFFKRDGYDYLLGIQLETAGPGSYDVVYRAGDAFTVTTIDTISLDDDAAYQIVITRQGDNLDWEVRRTADDVVVASGTEVIGGGWGLGTGDDLDIVLFSAGADAGGSVYIDNLRVYTVQQESRDLFVAITPVGGGNPITKRIFGVQGPTTERTDL